MKKPTKPKWKIEDIQAERSYRKYFNAMDMVNMFANHGIAMTRQTYSNKETGRTKFTVEEIQVLAKVFEMDLQAAIHLFNDWD